MKRIETSQHVSRSLHREDRGRSSSLSLQARLAPLQPRASSVPPKISDNLSGITSLIRYLRDHPNLLVENDRYEDPPQRQAFISVRKYEAAYHQWVIAYNSYCIDQSAKSKTLNAQRSNTLEALLQKFASPSSKLKEQRKSEIIEDRSIDDPSSASVEAKKFLTTRSQLRSERHKINLQAKQALQDKVPDNAVHQRKIQSEVKANYAKIALIKQQTNDNNNEILHLLKKGIQLTEETSPSPSTNKQLEIIHRTSAFLEQKNIDLKQEIFVIKQEIAKLKGTSIPENLTEQKINDNITKVYAIAHQIGNNAGQMSKIENQLNELNENGNQPINIQLISDLQAKYWYFNSENKRLQQESNDLQEENESLQQNLGIEQLINQIDHVITAINRATTTPQTNPEAGNISRINWITNEIDRLTKEKQNVGASSRATEIQNKIDAYQNELARLVMQ